MADPTAEAPAWLAWVFGTGGAGGIVYGAYAFVSAKLKAKTEEAKAEAEEARAERKAARAEAVENDIIKSLEKHVERMQAQIDRLTKDVAEQEEKIKELNQFLGEAMAARVQAMKEATGLREENVQLVAKINMQAATIEAQQAKITTLTQSYKGLSEWVGRLDLSESERSSGPYRDAAVWLVQNRDRLAGAA